MLKYTFCLLFAVLGVTTSVNNVTRCYYCHDDKSCIDPFNPSKANSVECSSLRYDYERYTGSFVFGCLKITSKDNNVTRTCVKKYHTNSDLCEFIIRESKDIMIVESCIYCDTDNCN